MSIKRAQVTSLEALAAWLNENATVFKTVTFSDNTLSATDAEDNTILKIADGTGGYFRAYISGTKYFGLDLARFPNYANTTIDIISCDNGLMIACFVIDNQNYGRDFTALFSKTNNGRVAIVFPSVLNSVNNQQYKNALHHVAFGDSVTMSSTTTFTPESGNQTVITPFITNADVGCKSYTPDAGYMPAHSNYSSGMNKFLLGADTYITNGYWCIKDGGAE